MSMQSLLNKYVLIDILSRENACFSYIFPDFSV